MTEHECLLQMINGLREGISKSVVRCCVSSSLREESYCVGWCDTPLMAVVILYFPSFDCCKC